jgi:hypothetical protein
MRTFLAGRGVAVSGTGVAEAMRGSMSSACAPPAGLASSAVTVALLASGPHAPAGTVALGIAKGVTRMFTLAKLKVAATIALVVTGFAGAAALPLATLARRTFTTVTTTSLMSDAAPATKPADESGKFVADAGKGVRVEFLGVSPFPGDESSWFNIAGEHIELPDPQLLESNVHAEPAPQHQLAIRIHRPKGVVVLPFIEGAMMAANTHSDAGADESYLLISRFTLQNPADTVSVRLGISGSDWKTIATSEDAQQQAEVDAGKYGGVTFSPPEKDDVIGGAKIDVHHDPFELPNQLIAIDDEGKEHIAHNVNVRNTNGDSVSTHTFELPAEKIKKLRLQLREFDKFVEAKDITLSAENKTQPKITVSDAKSKK